MNAVCEEVELYDTPFSNRTVPLERYERVYSEPLHEQEQPETYQFADADEAARAVSYATRHKMGFDAALVAIRSGM